MQKPRTNYITNKDLLAEIGRSKRTFCSYERPEYGAYDVIVANREAITPALLTQIQTSRLTAKVPPESEDVVFRVMTDEHIPPEGMRKRRAKGAPVTQRVNFPPFKHYVLRGQSLHEVGRSHWIGSISNGHFSVEHGKTSNSLAKMLMLLVERYSKRGNWRGYTYVDEMKGHALLQLSQIALQFDESKSDNPFAFYTTVIRNCFTRVLNLEKKNQHIRDDLLIMAGARPSFTRQIEDEMEQRAAASMPVIPAVEGSASIRPTEDE
jgi:hypothetical protein